MEGNKVKAQAKKIMEEHTSWITMAEVMDEQHARCVAEGCDYIYPNKGIPTQEERLNHQLDKLMEAGFTVTEPEKGRFGENVGETIESPGMVRWYNDSHYFLKRIGNMWQGVHKPDTFLLGLEHRYGDGAYEFSTSIEFDNDEAPDLMDRIAEFNGLPKYSTLKRQVEMLQKLSRDLDQPSQPVAILKRAILGDIEDILLEG